MKKLFIFCLLAVNFAFAQQTDSWLNSEADTIRLETLPGHNTAKRVGRMFKNLVSSKLNVGSLSSYTFTSGTAGTVPASGGGTSTYLRADGTWATLPSSTLPANANGVLYNNGSGTMSWNSLTSPLSGAGGVISIPQATISQNGYLSNTDWNTFNGKQNNLSNTPQITDFNLFTDTQITTIYYTASVANGWGVNYNHPYLVISSKGINSGLFIYSQVAICYACIDYHIYYRYNNGYGWASWVTVL